MAGDRPGRRPRFEVFTPGTPTDQAWKALAKCRHMDPELFFDLTAPGAARQARSICALCPVSTPCLEYAITWKERWGMWGGKTPSEREHIVVMRRLEQKGFR